ncbi:MAG TPA: hypothetical protein VM073_02835 [Usitatibacter sp.]|nr:hypothetical protein [Usitatibacter sp.]
MTDSDDELKRAYRGLAREEPPPAIDAAILARARKRTAARSGFARYAGPMSIAAVLVLGIGVSLRMQLEEPGVETSVPDPAPARIDPPTPPAEAVKPPPRTDPSSNRAEPRRRVAPAKPDAAPAPRAFPDDRLAAEQSVREAPPAIASVAPEVAAPAPAAPAAAAAPAPQARLKREGAAFDSMGARELRKSLAASSGPDPDPERELERIARMRETGDQAAADKALEEFRKRHPDFRIPDAMWARVRPR